MGGLPGSGYGGTTAVPEDELTMVVGTGTPLNVTTEFGSRLLPVMIRLTGAVPGTTLGSACVSFTNTGVGAASFLNAESARINPNPDWRSLAPPDILNAELLRMDLTESDLEDIGEK